MKQSAIFSILLLVCASSIFAQADASTAPAIWERYKIARHELSVDLPKMPVRIGSQDLCSFFTKTSFFSYADEAVYEITVVAKSTLPMPVPCREQRLFSADTLAARLDEIRTGKLQMTETSPMLNGRQTYKFAGEQNASAQVRWVIPDMENDRWIEAAVVRRNDKKPLEESFFKSLDLTGASGKEVGRGANTMLGDPVQPTTTAVVAETAVAAKPVYDTNAVGPGISPVWDPVQIIAKPKASYTDEARRAKVQGSVRLKVTLLPNGSVGPVTLVTELPKGLNEQAVAAARQLVFLPARMNGVAVAKAVTIEYNFSIY